MEGENEAGLEGYPKVVSYECTKKIMNQMENSISKISIEKLQGTGFFCKIPFPDKDNKLPVFITNNHVIKGDLLNKYNATISLQIKGEKEEKKIYLNDRIKYTNEEYDITIIEIKEKDNIDKKSFLKLDNIIIDDILENNNKNFQYKKQTIYIVQYPEGELSVSYGVLDKININKPFDFNHKCVTKRGSSGSPIINISNNKVIGIHKQGQLNKYNIGLFLNFPIKEFIELYCKPNYINNKNDNSDKESDYNSIKENNITKNIYKEIALFHKFKDSVNDVLILSDKRLCSCSSDCSIKIFDIRNSTFDLKIDKIKAHSDKIWCIEEIKKNILASGGKNDIKIWQINDNDLTLIKSINYAHNDYLNKIIKLNNNEFASCARDGKVKIWNENYAEKKCINAHSTYVNSILKLNNDILVSGSNGEGALKFWNLNDFSLYKTFNNIYSTAYNNSLIEIDNILFVGEKGGIRIFQVKNNNNIDSTIYKDSSIWILSLSSIGNDIIIAGAKNGNIYLYKIIKQGNINLENINVIQNNVKIVKNEFNYSISGLTYYSQYNKSFIISCSVDGNIKMYEYFDNEI